MPTSSLPTEASIDSVAIADVFPGVDLVAGSLRLADVEKSLSMENFREEFLAQALEGQLEPYDRVLLDCPPNLGDLTVNALYAADRVIVPISMSDRNAYKGGAHDLIRTIEVIQRKRPKLEVLAAVRNGVAEQRLLYKALNGELRRSGLSVAKTEIPQRADFQNSGAEGTPLVVSQPKSQGAQAYVALARELDRKLGDKSTQKAAA